MKLKLAFILGLLAGIALLVIHTCNALTPARKPKLPASMTCKKRPIVIAVIDTGFGITGKDHIVNLCKYGHKDFSTMQTFSDKFKVEDQVPVDNHGHGTHIAGLIDAYAKKSGTNYCIVILKYYDPHTVFPNDNMKSSIRAINYATNIKADFINYSGGGPSKDKDEQAAVKRFLDRGGKFVAAAGNEGADLIEHPYYPAMDDPRIVTVGSLTEKRLRSKTSNHGDPVKRWEIGENVKVFDMTMTGTSQATAIITGKMVSARKRACN